VLPLARSDWWYWLGKKMKGKPKGTVLLKLVLFSDESILFREDADDTYGNLFMNNGLHDISFKFLQKDKNAK
jgi:hypothetical protein